MLGPRIFCLQSIQNAEKTKQGGVPHDGTPYLLIAINKKREKVRKVGSHMLGPGLLRAGIPYLLIAIDPKRRKNWKMWGPTWWDPVSLDCNRSKTLKNWKRWSPTWWDPVSFDCNQSKAGKSEKGGVMLGPGVPHAGPPYLLIAIDWKRWKTEKGGVPHDGTRYLFIAIDPKRSKTEKGGVPHDGTPYLLIVINQKRQKVRKVGPHMLGPRIFCLQSIQNAEKTKQGGVPHDGTPYLLSVHRSWNSYDFRVNLWGFWVVLAPIFVIFDAWGQVWKLMIFYGYLGGAQGWGRKSVEGDLIPSGSLMEH